MIVARATHCRRYPIRRCSAGALSRSAERTLMTDRTLVGFDVSTFTHDARTHDVYRAGSGPAVIVIHELPGIHPGMVEFARRLIGAGYTVRLPSLFGRPGKPLTVPDTVRSN